MSTALVVDTQPPRRRNRRRSILALILGLLAPTAAACTDAGDATDEVSIDTAAEDGKADAAAELRVRVSDTTVWADPQLVRRGDALVITGRASRNLDGGNAFIIDDIYGELTQPSARRFEVAYRGGEIRGLLQGVGLFVGLNFVPSASRPDRLTAHTVARPRLNAFTGTGMSLTADVKPVVSGGRTVFRVSGRTTAKLAAVQGDLGATLGLIGPGETRLVDDTHFELDLLEDHVFALTERGARLAVRATLANGNVVEKQATLALRLTRLGLTATDAYDIWPNPTCTARVKSCLTALPGGTLDLARCGEARPVLACTRQVGQFVTDDRLATAIGGIDARLARTGLATGDAAALVGADRVDQLLEAASATVEQAITDQAGRWYVGAASVDAALTASIDRAIAGVYARPGELVEPHAPAPGNIAATGQVAADALLAYLAVTDFTRTEFARSLDELTTTFRAQHLAALRAFRTSILPEPYQPGTVVYVGDWLGAHTEITINTSTGAATNVLVEID